MRDNDIRDSSWSGGKSIHGTLSSSVAGFIPEWYVDGIVGPLRDVSGADDEAIAAWVSIFVCTAWRQSFD